MRNDRVSPTLESPPIDHSDNTEDQEPKYSSWNPIRLFWLGLGFFAVALGGIGIFLPGLPTTIFMIIAAACFARSSPRFERWVLELPTIGRMVRDYRRGLGMPRKAKISAILTMVIFCGLSVGFFIEPLMIRITVALFGLVGVWYVGWRVPTREQVRSEVSPEET